MLRYAETLGLRRASQLDDRQVFRLGVGPEFARRMGSSRHTLQPRHHRLIQQINRLLEAFILDERRIRLLSSLDRSMAEQMLNICDSSISTQ